MHTRKEEELSHREETVEEKIRLALTYDPLAIQREESSVIDLKRSFHMGLHNAGFRGTNSIYPQVVSLPFDAE